MKFVLAGGSGSLGQRLADEFASHGHEVVVLTRSPRPSSEHREMHWDGLTVGPWADELNGAVVVNLAGALVDRRPTRRNTDVLRRSRVEPTRCLVQASKQCDVAPSLWLQMSTLAIYGDAGQGIIAEGHPSADGPPQMPGVAIPWEQAAEDARCDRQVVMRTGLVLEAGTPALDRLVLLTRLGLGGKIASGTQWISWLHIDDFIGAVRFIIDTPQLNGTVHITSPSPLQNSDMLAALRSALGRRWAPPTPEVLVRLGAIFMQTDPALALTGRRCVPQRLLDAGFEFNHPTFEDAVVHLLSNAD